MFLCGFLCVFFFVKSQERVDPTLTVTLILTLTPTLTPTQAKIDDPSAASPRVFEKLRKNVRTTSKIEANLVLHLV